MRWPSMMTKKRTKIPIPRNKSVPPTEGGRGNQIIARIPRSRRREEVRRTEMVPIVMMENRKKKKRETRS